MSSTVKDFPVCTTHGRIHLLRLKHFLNQTIKKGIKKGKKYQRLLLTLRLKFAGVG